MRHAHSQPFKIGVRDLVARGYSIPGGVSQRGVGRPAAFRVARCQIWTQVGHPGWPRTQNLDNRKVTFGIDHTPLHRIAVQFEWAEPFGELQ